MTFETLGYASLVAFGALMVVPAVLLAYGCGSRDARERRSWDPAPHAIPDREARALADERNELDRLRAARLVCSEQVEVLLGEFSDRPGDYRLARFRHLEL